MSLEERSIDELTLGVGVQLEELLERGALEELLASVSALSGMPLRVLGTGGKPLADTGPTLGLYTRLSAHRALRAPIEGVVGGLRRAELAPGQQATHACVTGAAYRVAAIQYDGRSVGRIVLGPYAPEGTTAPAASLFELAPDLPRAEIEELFRELPRPSERLLAETVRHVGVALGLLLFSEHRALLSGSMHLASVRESFRGLEQKNVELQVAYERLRDLDRLKSNFLATVSHELRTPLTSIIGYSEMLVEGLAGELSAEQHDFVGTIREKGEQLLSLIKSLLDLSKLESGTMSVDKGMVTPADVVTDVLSTLQPQAMKRQLKLSQRLDADLPAIWADSQRLRQILLNLVENAIKFTPPGGSVLVDAKLTTMAAPALGDAGAVLLGARRPAVQFRVTDTGIGIAGDEKPRVLDPFYQIDASSTRRQGGAGLGLSIVKRLIDAHEGTLSIEDNVPAGSVFVVTLPARRASVA